MDKFGTSKYSNDAMWDLCKLGTSTCKNGTALYPYEGWLREEII